MCLRAAFVVRVVGSCVVLCSVRVLELEGILWLKDVFSVLFKSCGYLLWVCNFSVVYVEVIEGS